MEKNRQVYIDKQEILKQKQIMSAIFEQNKKKKTAAAGLRDYLWLSAE